MSAVRIPKIRPPTPAWAETFGVDRHGLFAGISVNDVEHLFRWIEPGRFRMGSPEHEMGRDNDEGPPHDVRIPRGFWIGRTPVTQQFYEAVAGNNPSRFQGDALRPVERVSWQDTQQFCRALSDRLAEREDAVARLPSEAEWEYACRAGTTEFLYSRQELTSETGACPNLNELAWYGKNSGNTTHPVAQKAPNAWGLYDMLGNVWEWCEDTWHDSYVDAPEDGSAWITGQGSLRVYRGGSWANRARRCRCASRNYWLPGDLGNGVGFRLVLSLSSSMSPVRSR